MFEINYRDPRPIYEQIVESVRRLIVTGILRPEEKLPSVRQLAAKHAINPNTIARAYRQLEEEGYIYTASGKGSFVSPEQSGSSTRREELLLEFDKITRELLFLNVSPEELTGRIRLLGDEAAEPEKKESAGRAGTDGISKESRKTEESRKENEDD